MTLYTIIEVDADGLPEPEDQHVTIHPTLGHATALHGDLAGPERFRVYQLVEPGGEPVPDFTRHDRTLALDLAVKLHIEDGLEPVEVVQSAAHFAAFLAEGTVPAGLDTPRIEVVRNDEQIEVHIDGEVVASTTYDQSGHAGMDAVEAAAVRVARALGCELEESGA